MILTFMNPLKILQLHMEYFLPANQVEVERWF